MSKLHEAIASAGELSENTRDRYRRDLDVFVAFAGEHADEWTENTLDVFKQHLVAKPLAPTSVERMLSSVRTAMRLLREPELTDDQIAKLLATCEAGTPIDLRDRALITIIIECGIKLSELPKLAIDTVLHASKLTPAARDALAPWLKWLLDYATRGPLFRSLATNQPHAFGHAISSTGIKKMLDARGERAGIGHIDVTMLRRVHARRSA